MISRWRARRWANWSTNGRRVLIFFAILFALFSIVFIDSLLFTFYLRRQDQTISTPRPFFLFPFPDRATELFTTNEAGEQRDARRGQKRKPGKSSKTVYVNRWMISPDDSKLGLPQRKLIISLYVPRSIKRPRAYPCIDHSLWLINRAYQTTASRIVITVSFRGYNTVFDRW